MNTSRHQLSGAEDVLTRYLATLSADAKAVYPEITPELWSTGSLLLRNNTWRRLHSSRKHGLTTA